MAENETAWNKSTTGKPFSLQGKTNPTHQSVSHHNQLLITLVASSAMEINGALFCSKSKHFFMLAGPLEY